MSKFKTTILVDVAAVLALLPQGAYVHPVVWDPERSVVDVVWEHDKCVTSHDFPVDFPLGVLRDNEPLPFAIKCLPGLHGPKEKSQPVETVPEITQPIATGAPVLVQSVPEIMNTEPAPVNVATLPAAASSEPGAATIAVVTAPVPTKAAEPVAVKAKRK